MKGRDVLTFGLICLAAGVLTLRPAFAQPKYPEHSIKLIIPFAPGGLSGTRFHPMRKKIDGGSTLTAHGRSPGKGRERLVIAIRFST